MNVYPSPQFAYLPLFHGGNTGSNPVGDAKNFNGLATKAETGVMFVSRMRSIGSLYFRPGLG